MAGKRARRAATGETAPFLGFCKAGVPFASRVPGQQMAPSPAFLPLARCPQAQPAISSARSAGLKVLGTVPPRCPNPWNQGQPGLAQSHCSAPAAPGQDISPELESPHPAVLWALEVWQQVHVEGWIQFRQTLFPIEHSWVQILE